MNTRMSTIKHSIPAIAVCLALLSTLFATLAMAHGGLEHVIGTVSNVSDASITVTTGAGKSIEVTLDGKTTFSKNNQAIQRADVKVGDRVVIHAEKSGTKLIAHTVQIGAATAAKTVQH
jgi:hypothetical protein